MQNFDDIVSIVKHRFKNQNSIYLHEPCFIGNEKKYLNSCIDSSYVSSIGEFVSSLEKEISSYTGSNYGIAMVNGTSALSIALKAVGVKETDEVITQALTFVATANAIVYNGANPIFVDVDIDTMGLSPTALENFLIDNAIVRENHCYNKISGNKISACLPMHTFGFPARIEEIVSICKKWFIPIVEDAAEALGSYKNNKHMGAFGDVGVFSFNGNKIITSGGGGAIITNDKTKATWIKHVTTTAKKSHPFNYYHDELGYNYRMPNLNAALLSAQLEKLDEFLINKRETALYYKNAFNAIGIKLKWETAGSRANFWLNCLEMENKKYRDQFLNFSNAKGIMTRPIWNLMFDLPMYKDCIMDSQKNARFLADRIVNIPSGINPDFLNL
ncbi:MAG: LegC family aminotransferase [Crocinitomicaceae bacterium]|nr:LegC family aminotransferase [Crocinitomicaceae bacterium]